MGYRRMFLVFSVVVMAAMIDLVSGSCTSDIQTCAGGGSATVTPGSVPGFTTNAINTVCADATSMNNALDQSKCVYRTIRTPACNSQYGRRLLPPLDWDRVLSSFMYICANKDAYVRATACFATYSNEFMLKYAFTECVADAFPNLMAAIDRSKSEADQALQQHCTVNKGVEDMCIKITNLPDCQAGDLEVFKTATLKALPRACAA